MITRSFGNAFEVQDWTSELQMIPLVRTPLSDINLFRDESVNTHTVAFEQTFGTLGLVNDSARGSAPQANKDETRKIHTYQVPYHKIVDYLTAADLQGKRAYGSADTAETEAAALERKMTRISRSFTMTREYARFYALTQGAIWSPSGLISSNYYTDFGVTRKTVAFALSTATTEVLGKIEEIIAHIQDNALSGDVISGVVGLCSPEFFSALVSHPKCYAAFQMYSSTQEPFRNRLGGNTTLYREFQWGGILFREIRDSANGNRFIPANEAYFVPVGTEDTFITYSGPGNKIELANTLGEQMYMWVYNDPKGEKREIEAEMNQVHLVRRPQVVVKATKD